MARRSGCRRRRVGGRDARALRPGHAAARADALDGRRRAVRSAGGGQRPVALAGELARTRARPAAPGRRRSRAGRDSTVPGGRGGSARCSIEHVEPPGDHRLHRLVGAQTGAQGTAAPAASARSTSASSCSRRSARAPSSSTWSREVARGERERRRRRSAAASAAARPGPARERSDADAGEHARDRRGDDVVARVAGVAGLGHHRDERDPRERAGREQRARAAAERGAGDRQREHGQRHQLGEVDEHLERREVGVDGALRARRAARGVRRAERTARAERRRGRTRAAAPARAPARARRATRARVRHSQSA